MQKRRKITESMTVSQIRSVGSSQLDNVVSIYSGLKEWREQNYLPQVQLLQGLFRRLNQNYDAFDSSSDPKDKIVNLVSLLTTPLTQMSVEE